MGELSTEIFEQHQAELLGKSYQELKAYFDENIRLFGVRYNTGSQYEKEWNTWCTAWRFQQSKIEQLEKELAQMKHINDEQDKNLKTAFKTIHIQRKFDADSQGTIACLTEMNGRLEKRIKEGLEKIEQCEKEGCLFPEWLYWAKKTLRGECE